VYPNMSVLPEGFSYEARVSNSAVGVGACVISGVRG
jgi:hypothetical protein